MNRNWRCDRHYYWVFGGDDFDKYIIHIVTSNIFSFIMLV